MNFKDFNIYCISLKRREDRRSTIKNHLNSLGIDFEFVDAIDSLDIEGEFSIPKGAIGCNLSHLKIYKQVMGSNKPVLILEDDVEFSSDVIEKIKDIQIPEDWALLYFGGNHNGLELDMIDANLHRLKKTFTTHCFAINPKIITEIIEKFTFCYDRFVIDEFLAYEIQTKYPCYGIHPHLAWQTTGFSDIQNTNVDYNFLK